MATFIPVIDFGKYGLLVDDEKDVSNSDLQELANEVYGAFSTIGFCYIKNHGIPKQEIEKMFQISKRFYDLPVEVKRPLARSEKIIHGWTGLGKEKFYTDKPGDLKEAFDYMPRDNGQWPDSELPELREIYQKLFATCTKLAYRLLDIVSIGLELQDRDFFRKCHAKIGKENGTSLRSVMYSPLPTDGSINPGQERCGEHTDFGTLTFLFQDDVGGLEVRNTKGEYIDAKPVPDAICVNIGDMMQRWTADKLLATKHRVRIPREELRTKRGRQSVVYFIHPDDDCLVTCLDGSNKYEPITDRDYSLLKANLTHG